MTPVRILFDLRAGWGLGDAVQGSILFKHLKKYRPAWVVDCRAPSGFNGALSPNCHAVWPSDSDPLGEYESVIHLNWTDCFETYADRPSTKVAYALRRMFRIEEYDAVLGRYEVAVSKDERDRAIKALDKFGKNVVAWHFEGSSHPQMKNLSSGDQTRIRIEIVRSGMQHVGISALPLAGAGEISGFIANCRAFVGIDSGPGKVASATETPSLICWTGHHPLRYHDPAPNTTHLIPEDWHSMPPFREPGSLGSEIRKAVLFFHANYKFITYRPGELAQEACRWLRETLR